MPTSTHFLPSHPLRLLVLNLGVSKFSVLVLSNFLEPRCPYSENLRIPCFHRTPDLGLDILLSWSGLVVTEQNSSHLPPKRPVIELHHQKKGLKPLSPADGSILRHAGTSDAGIHHWSTLRLFHPMVSVHLIFHTPLMANLYKFPISITNKSRWKCPMWQIYGMLPMVSRPKLHRDHREPHIMFQNWASFDLTYPINCRMGRFWPFEKAQSTLIFGPKCNLKISQTRW